MTAVHRDTDDRKPACGAQTEVILQTTVFVNGLLAAVEGDQNTPGHGNLVSPSAGTVIVAGRKLIVITDTDTEIDDATHISTADDPDEGSPNVNAY